MIGQPLQVDLPIHWLGDKWPGFPKIGPITFDGLTPTKPLARVVMRCQRFQYTRRMGKPFVLDSKEGEERNGPISIDNAATWEASIAELQKFLPEPGDWTWNMAVYEEGDESPITIYQGVITVQVSV